MIENDAAPEEAPSPLELGQAAAAQLGNVPWELEAELPEMILEEEPPPEVPIALPTKPEPIAVVPSEPPPSPEQIVEAMLFVGGHPLTESIARSAVRGLTAEGFQEAIDALNRRYRKQRRPYSVQPRDDGFVLAILPAYRNLRDRLFAGPREARLNQAAIDVLSAIAYRQPLGKAEIDSLRGLDSGGTLRQLVRLGLIAVQHRAEAGAREVRYGTTPRFLQVFGLGGLDELPRLGETSLA
ncbi:MAG TPA: SMC-Scp complex subunit ScpB [Urbifossiella sp.]